MPQPAVHTPTVGRPYRSHKIPACDFCHRRKSRCVRVRIDEPCVLCQSYQMPCETSSGGRTVAAAGRRSGAAGKRRMTSHAESQPGRSTLPNQASQQEQNKTASPSRPLTPPSADTVNVSVPFDDASAATAVPSSRASGAAVLNQASHIVGPALARDAQVLEKYISPAYSSIVSHARPNPYSVYSDDPRNPVVYMKVPRQRGVDPSGNGTSGFKQCETIEKILQPLGPEVFNLYFDVVHPAFPILDKRTVVNSYHQNGLPHALVCEMYAVSLISWHLSPKIRASGRPIPDVRYIWNLAVSAMREDFMSPSFSTVLAAILDLLGRPITSITYNAVNVGSTVALAHSLGLNRDPAKWNLDKRQKSLRVRAWWCLLIHDNWASLSHGTPSHIQNDQWDVALPDLDSLAIGSKNDDGFDSDSHRKGARSFIALCQLTKILGSILPLIYSLKPQKEEAGWRILRRVEAAMDEWEDELPYFLRPNGSDLQRDAPGALNLQLSFLAVKMLICRVAVQISDSGDEDIQYHRSRYRKAAKAVIDFVLTLTPDELWVFWLPYAAYHFTSAATLMMRCALEATDEQTAQECIASVKGLLDYLRRAKDTANWDLAEICLGQCESIMEQMSQGSFGGQHARRQFLDHSTASRRHDSREQALANRSMPAGEDSLVDVLPSTRPPAYRLSNINAAVSDGGNAARAEPESSRSDVDLTMMDTGPLGDYLLENDFSNIDFFSNLWQSNHL